MRLNELVSRYFAGGRLSYKVLLTFELAGGLKLSTDELGQANKEAQIWLNERLPRDVRRWLHKSLAVTEIQLLNELLRSLGLIDPWPATGKEFKVAVILGALAHTMDHRLRELKEAGLKFETLLFHTSTRPVVTGTDTDGKLKGNPLELKYYADSKVDPKGQTEATAAELVWTWNMNDLPGQKAGVTVIEDPAGKVEPIIGQMVRDGYCDGPFVYVTNQPFARQCLTVARAHKELGLAEPDFLVVRPNPIVPPEQTLTNSLSEMAKMVWEFTQMKSEELAALLK